MAYIIGTNGARPERPSPADLICISAGRQARFRAMATVETLETERLVALVLGEAERDALVRVLYVVKDNFWLDEVEESLLERLLERGES